MKGRPGDDGATTFRNEDLKKRLRVVSGLKLEENLELNVYSSQYGGFLKVWKSLGFGQEDRGPEKPREWSNP